MCIRDRSWGYIGGEIFRCSPGRIGTTAEVKDTRNVPLLQTKRMSAFPAVLEGNMDIFGIVHAYTATVMVGNRVVHHYKRDGNGIKG